MITLTSQGFTQNCFTIPAGKAIPGVLTNGITNSSTGLTVTAEFTVARLTAPVVGQPASPSSTATPGIAGASTLPSPVATSSATTALSGAIPNVVLSNAIYTSPAAPDGNPVSFDLPALPSGEYVLQLPTYPTVPSAVLVVTSSAATVAPAALPATTTTIANTSGISVVSPSTADISGVVDAFDSWESLPSTCTGQIVAGSDQFALVSSTNSEWAMATFQPASTCSATLGPASPGAPSRTLTPSQIGPFAGGYNPVAVFEKSSGGQWVMNDEGGTPFPCPAPAGDAPGPGNGALPPGVLAVWNLPYAANCAFVAYKPQPSA